MKVHFFHVPSQGTDDCLCGGRVGLSKAYPANVLLENVLGGCHLQHANMDLELLKLYLNVLGEDYD